LKFLLDARQMSDWGGKKQGFDPVRHMLQHLPKEGINQSVFDSKVAQKIQQLDVITQKLSKQVMEHHEEMEWTQTLVKGHL